MFNKFNIQKFFTIGVISLLILIILLQRSCVNNTKPKDIIITKIDTVWKTKVDTVIKNIKSVTVLHPVIPNIPTYQPSDNIDSCKLRFNNLLKLYYAKRVYKDTLKLDQLGNIEITDTVFLNQLQKRLYIQNIKIPTVEKTVTITKQAEPRRQIYVGGNLFGENYKIQMISPGVLYKSKKDHIYQVNLGINFDGSITYGIGTYWKIQLK